MIIQFAASNMLSLGAVADLLGVDSKTIAKWMTGELVPHSSMQKPIEEILRSSCSNSANNSDT